MTRGAAAEEGYPRIVQRPSPWIAVIAARASFGAITVWIALTTILRATGPEPLWTLLDLPFRVMCHRLPGRVLSAAGVPLPLCSRCLGIWVGLSLSAVIAWPDLPLRRLRVVLVVSALLMLVEVLTQELGLHPVFHPTRLLTGLLVSVPVGGAIGGLMSRELIRRRG